jgi:RHS repeat-associated protein
METDLRLRRFWKYDGKDWDRERAIVVRFGGGCNERLTTATYDANGNQLDVAVVPGSEMLDALTSMSYDISNRLVRAENNGPTRRSDYDYDAGNKRIWEKRTVNSSTVGEWAYFFGITGQRMGRYTFVIAGVSITFTQVQASVWFGGKLVQKFEGTAMSYASQDRLGSVGRYLPYGEAHPAGSGNTAPDVEKFATYTRDAGTGLDYADQRWHVPGSGRFLTSDPYRASSGPTDPGSWNRFGYVRGNPANRVDPRGLIDCRPDPETGSVENYLCNLPDPTNAPEQQIEPNTNDQVKLSAARTDAIRAKANGARNGEALGLLNKLGAKCKKLLSSKINAFQMGPSLDSLEYAVANKINFTDSGDLSNDFELGDLGYASGFRVRQAIHGDYAIAGIGSARDIIVLNSNLWSMDLSLIQVGNRPALSDEQVRVGVIVHEALHAYLGRDDADLVEFLFGVKAVNPGEASKTLTERLASDNCPEPKT